MTKFQHVTSAIFLFKDYTHVEQFSVHSQKKHMKETCLKWLST